MSGPSMHRAMCKKVACLECDSLETNEGQRRAALIFNRIIADFNQSLYLDSTVQPGRQVMRDWDFVELVKEMAADD